MLFRVSSIWLLAALTSTATTGTSACPYLKAQDERKLQGGRGGGRPGANNGRGGRGGGGRGRVGGGGRGGQGGGGGGNPGGNIPLDPNDVVATEGLSVDEALAAAKSDILDIMNNNRAADFIRLSFHDCIGGCNGCVDTTNPENFGLSNAIDDLAGIVVRYSETLTTADIWVLAALTASETQQPGNNPLPFDMQFVGRPSCGDPQGGPDVPLPSSHITTPDLQEFFTSEFGFTDRDTTAIIGVHTLGQALSQNSGFDGRAGWVPDEDTLDNQYYNVLLQDGGVDPIFRPELQNNGNNPNFPDQFLWRRGNGNLFMLNVDMALAKDFSSAVDPITGELFGCDLEDCPDSVLLPIALEYTGGNGMGVWINDFRAAMIKMTNNGCDGQVCTPV